MDSSIQMDTQEVIRLARKTIDEIHAERALYKVQADALPWWRFFKKSDLYTSAKWIGWRDEGIANVLLSAALASSGTTMTVSVYDYDAIS